MLRGTHGARSEQQSRGCTPGSLARLPRGSERPPAETEQPAAKCSRGFPHPHPTCLRVGGELVTQRGTCSPALGFLI